MLMTKSNTSQWQVCWATNLKCPASLNCFVVLSSMWQIMTSYSSCCNNYKSLDRLPKSHVFGDKGELWKLQGQHEIPGRWSFFSEGMCRSWTRRKLADLYLRHLHRVMVRSLQHTQFSSMWHLLSSKEEDRRLGARLKKQSRISVVLWQSQWKKEPCIKPKTGLLDETSARFWSYTE